MGLKQQIVEIADRICREQNLHLIDVEVKGDANRTVFQIFADSITGITLGECERVSRLIMDEIDMDDAFPRNYRLDVSSPGLDRPLKTDFDFQKNVGYDLSVQVLEEDEKKTYTGQLLRSDADFIYLTDKKGGEKAIRRKDIDRAKVKLKW